MKHATNCKVCAKPIVVTIDDAYAKLGDPLNLLKMATCNRCYDLRTKRNTIESAIKRICEDLVQGVVHKEQKPVVAKQLEALTRKYAHLVSDWHNRSGIIWEPAFPQMLMEKPRLWGDILNGYWKTWKRQQGTEQRELQAV